MSDKDTCKDGCGKSDAGSIGGNRNPGGCDKRYSSETNEFVDGTFLADKAMCMLRDTDCHVQARKFIKECRRLGRDPMAVVQRIFMSSKFESMMSPKERIVLKSVIDILVDDEYDKSKALKIPKVNLFDDGECDFGRPPLKVRTFVSSFLDGLFDD